ncbi:phosphatidylserine/phosphatidylglycerophosphate/cardiolipin synthase-like enzyme, partial [Streptomyces sp. PvR018]
MSDVIETPAYTPLDRRAELDPRVCEERSQRLRRRLERLIGIAATEGNSLIPLRNGDQIFGAMLKAIREAEHTVDMMTFVYWR